jgi:CBS domain-containing protein
MDIGRICNREVRTVSRSEPLARAAREMCEQHVGMLVVTEEHAGNRIPVGVLTDRDIVRAQLHRAADLNCLSVDEAMSSDLLVVGENASLAHAIARMRESGVRRAPVVNARGALVGVVSIDDLLGLIAQELSGLSQLVAAQPARERREHPSP